jgi:phosphate transport system permease protein
MVPSFFKISDKMREKGIHWLLAGTACTSLVTLGAIMLFLFAEGLPVFAGYDPVAFFLGKFWYPTAEPPEFGILSLLAGSVAVMFLATAIAVPLGVFTAAYLAEIAGGTVRRMVKPFIELLAALPSVVIGFFGMVVVAPFLQERFELNTGLNLFNAALMLAFMSVPTICSVAEDALFAVPRSLREASLALGATRWETTSRVVLPAALSGIGTAIMLGMSRAVGETMVVLMVAGGAAMLPGSVFDPVRPMPASIAAEMAEAPFRGEHYHALFATGLVLFLFTWCFNLVAGFISERYKQTGSSEL